MRCKAYLSEDGTLGVAVWNDTGKDAECVFTSLLSGKKAVLGLKKDMFGFAEV